MNNIDSPQKSPGPMLEMRIASNRFSIGKLIGKGGYGAIYHGTELKTGYSVAIKMEEKKDRPFSLDKEAEVISKLQKEKGFPRFLWYGEEGDYRILVMELLGPSIYEMYKYCGRKMSLKTVLLLADQVLFRIEELH